MPAHEKIKHRRQNIVRRKPLLHRLINETVWVAQRCANDEICQWPRFLRGGLSRAFSCLFPMGIKAIVGEAGHLSATAAKLPRANIADQVCAQMGSASEQKRVT
jgi:hypothetical protein